MIMALWLAACSESPPPVDLRVAGAVAGLPSTIEIYQGQIHRINPGIRAADVSGAQIDAGWLKLFHNENVLAPDQWPSQGWTHVHLMDASELAQVPTDTEVRLTRGPTAPATPPPIAPGQTADLTVVDQAGAPVATIVGGDIIWANPEYLSDQPAH